MKAIRKAVFKNFVSLNGELISYSDLTGVIEALEGTDGMFTAVTIHDSALATALVAEGFVSRNVRGSYYCKDETKRAAFSEKLEALDFSRTEERDYGGGTTV